eukprot:353524-Chlamydomonas_euryale.AAC.5
MHAWSSARQLSSAQHLPAQPSTSQLSPAPTSLARHPHAWSSTCHSLAQHSQAHPGTRKPSPAPASSARHPPAQSGALAHMAQRDMAAKRIDSAILK